ncbi:MAG: hypothetical protein AAGI01_15845, partial [Myxococcota bacterium]
MRWLSARRNGGAPEVNLEAWMASVGHSIMTDALRRRREAPLDQYIGEAEELPGGDPDPATESDRKERLTKLREILGDAARTDDERAAIEMLSDGMQAGNLATMAHRLALFLVNLA